ncbi:DUF2231 domain-containing protein [Microvirga aerophila]|uniref:DUF2231 domain-containing protein n=2 Tax=Microvirga aerophila TaxID=670291 RepID=A0A512BVM8_9HYPH|nr:DUF2231 domain-containing protein [Microvirga aerophila]GEO16021.1 hypothetical protein MAE02_37170 [Microvirga aerophila]
MEEDRETAQPEQGSRARPARGLPSTAAVMGHPIHPMLIPYPITFLTAALATDVAARATQDPFWSRTSRWMLGAGLVTGLVAGAVGAIDYFTIRRAREKSVGKLHAYGNPLALGLAAANLALRQKRQAGVMPGAAEIGLSTATVVVLGVTGWAGAELSYRHMVGVAGHGDQHTEEEKRYVP